MPASRALRQYYQRQASESRMERIQERRQRKNGKDFRTFDKKKRADAYEYKYDNEAESCSTENRRDRFPVSTSSSKYESKSCDETQEEEWSISLTTPRYDDATKDALGREARPLAPQKRRMKRHCGASQKQRDQEDQVVPNTARGLL